MRWRPGLVSRVRVRVVLGVEVDGEDQVPVYLVLWALVSASMAGRNVPSTVWCSMSSAPTGPAVRMTAPTPYWSISENWAV